MVQGYGIDRTAIVPSISAANVDELVALAVGVDLRIHKGSRVSQSAIMTLLCERRAAATHLPSGLG